MDSKKILILLFGIVIFSIFSVSVNATLTTWDYYDNFSSHNTTYMIMGNGNVWVTSGVLYHAGTNGVTTSYLNYHTHFTRAYIINASAYMKDVTDNTLHAYFGFTDATLTDLNGDNIDNFIGFFADHATGLKIIKRTGDSQTVIATYSFTINTNYYVTIFFNKTTVSFYIDGDLKYTMDETETSSLTWLSNTLYLHTYYINFNSPNAKFYLDDLNFTEIYDNVIDTASISLVTDAPHDEIENITFNIMSEFPRITIEKINNTFIYSGVNNVTIDTSTMHIFSGVNPLEFIQILLRGGGDVLEKISLLLGKVVERVLETLTIIISHATALMENIRTFIKALTKPTPDGTAVDNLVRGAVVLVILILPTLMIKEAFGNIVILPSLLLMTIVCWLGQLIPLWLMVFMIFMLLIAMFRGNIKDRMGS